MPHIYTPLLGGILIGIATCIILLSIGKITGISGILAKGLFAKKGSDKSWRLIFLLGLLFGGFTLKIIDPTLFQNNMDSNLFLVGAAGILVGLGTRIGSGCTSGHGVCGIGRRSKRSIVATITFMSFGVITVYIRSLL